MKNKVLIIGVLFIGFFLSIQSGYTQCTDMTSDRLKMLLSGASYDNFRMTKIEYAPDPYDIEFQVDLLKKYTYQLVFDMSGKPEGVVIKLFDLGTKKEKKEPELMYTSSEDIIDKNAVFDVSFDAPKTKIMVKYEVKDATYEGCVTFVLGVLKYDTSKTAKLD